MAQIKKKKYIINAAGTSFSLKLPAYYDDIKTHVGLTEANDAALKTAFPTNINDLKRAGQIIEFVVTRNAGGKRRTTRLIADIDTAKTAMDAVEGKQFGTGLAGGAAEITNAYFPVRHGFR